MLPMSFKLKDKHKELELISLLNGIFIRYTNIVIVCVGTDKTTGDSLGPLVGTFILEQLPSVQVYGTLTEPVHALNLVSVVKIIKQKHADAYILAVDASFGRPERIGMISFKPEPLIPGIGLRKVLPRVGHASITGIVNSAGLFGHLALQNTRLSIIYFLARTISNIITQALICHQASYNQPTNQQA